MNREEYFAFHKTLTERMCEITKQKNADYTGAAGDDPFANFNRVGSLGVCSTEQGFMVRMLDKYMRINSFVQKGVLQVKDESVEDTLLDLANYCLLFLGYLESKKTDSELQTSFDGLKDVLHNAYSKVVPENLNPVAPVFRYCFMCGEPFKPGEESIYSENGLFKAHPLCLENCKKKR